ncbi:MAG TPA: hydrolase, partial [Leptospiraceae bacterium]|nr:hydrolase [Leptospiraceae bacterium]
LLILNSEDDPICINENVLENLHWLEKLPHTVLVHTKRGSHVAFFEGIRAEFWSDRVIGEYFQAVLRQSRRKRQG